MLFRKGSINRLNKAGLGLQFGAIAGLLFLHIPLLLIILYAFTTEDKSYQFPPPGYTLKWFEYWELEDLNSDESTQSIEVSADEDTASNRSLVSDQENADDESLTPSQAKSIDKLRQLYNRGMIKQSVFEYEVKLILESNN